MGAKRSICVPMRAKKGIRQHRHRERDMSNWIGHEIAEAFRTFFLPFLGFLWLCSFAWKLFRPKPPRETAFHED